jgi:FKBP-type peptidyl-prolyl cis-trans isomerase FklB
MKQHMKNGFKAWLALTLAAGVVQEMAAADNKPGLKDDKEKVSYGIGMNIGTNLKRSGYDVDVDVLANAIKDVISGAELKMTEAEAREALMAYQKQMNAKREEERLKTAEKNKKAADAFLAENKKKPGVKTHKVALPDGTEAELQYKVISEGTGTIPKSNDVVVVNYRGTLIDGKEFDSSAKQGQPLKRAANQLVRGWTEALQLMKVGSKWEIYLPASLAYGDRGSGPIIEPGAALVFEMELVGIENPQPLTSDIIRVPSADELKAGAKVEVIKPEDIERIKAEEKAKAEAAQKKKP